MRLACLLLAACGANPAAPAWHDEFDGPAGASYDRTKWNPDVGGGGWGNAEREIYSENGNAALDGNGHLVITARGDFTSRKGVGPGSISHHPMGIPHGPHPGSYEKSIGTQRTDELAVMCDTFAPLHSTPAAREIEDGDYHASFL